MELLPPCKSDLKLMRIIHTILKLNPNKVSSHQASIILFMAFLIFKKKKIQWAIREELIAKPKVYSTEISFKEPIEALLLDNIDQKSCG